MGNLLRESGTSEPVAASKFISSTVGEQVSREYAKGWCRCKDTHSEVKHAPNPSDHCKHSSFFAKARPIQTVFLLPPNGILSLMHLWPPNINFRPIEREQRNAGA